MRSLQKLIIDEFSTAATQQEYRALAETGLWAAEKHFLEKYCATKGRMLDLGCGSGRTTIPLMQLGYDVVGVDVVPAMIQTAKDIAEEKGLNIDYRVGDATSLDFPEMSFDYAFFSNQGWTQIPGREQRQKALSEVARVLKQGGIFIFTTHQRVFRWNYTSFWPWRWLRLYVLKPLGVPVQEQEFGDSFFVRETPNGKSKQYIHMPHRNTVLGQLAHAGFELLEMNDTMQNTPGVRRFPPIFYVCRKK